MRSRLRRHFNPPTVISVIALCIAMAGGYAAAFTGSGSVERAKEVGIRLSGFETVVTLTDIGKLQASCAGTGSPISLRFKNTSPKRLVSRSFEENSGDYQSAEPDPGEFSSTVSVAVGAETVHWHLSPAGGAGRPQADISVTVTPSIAGEASCSRAEVAIIATTTEQ